MSLNQELIATQLTEWMVNFVEKPNPLLNGWPPCPYARQARLSGRMSIRFCTVPEFNDVIRESMWLLDSKDVVVICFDHTTISPEDLERWVYITNKESLMPINYVVLEDHPDAPELLNGVQMNFGHCGLLLLSKLNVLNDASDKLKEKGYYDHWPKENLDNVVSWRYNKA